ncbi:DEAD/DEAH box helicase [bacterium]|nr:DEAD/DEAH box helicase [candidate division CSSED10-310 bacterium]
MTGNPLIIQSDRSILLHTDSPRYGEARDRLTLFAELVKSPEYVHTYRITPLSLWNAASCGITHDRIEETLTSFSRYPVPPNILREIKDYMERYGRIKLRTGGRENELLLSCDDEALLIELMHQPGIQKYVISRLDARTLRVPAGVRGHLKQALVHHGFPVEDLAGYRPGKPLDIDLRDTLRSGSALRLRYYQEEAVAGFWSGGSAQGGSGVIVLPCGAGKTLVGMAAMTRIRQYTLILVTNITALRQWRNELLDKTTLSGDQIGEYSGERKDFKPVTITTYQILTYRRSREEDFLHMPLFNRQDWGLIIYDEVHLLPAPVFRFTAEIQSKRRLGLTATLVREDGRENDVFSLIGPKKYDVPWKILEDQGWIARAVCTEIRLELQADERMRYAVAPMREKYRIASTNPRKIDLLRIICRLHRGENILIIGQYLSQLDDIAQAVGAPLITGATPNADREILFANFRSGTDTVLVVSKVANFAIDLPEASVAVQVSGTFGSRQEEAQRLGRILRPKKSGGPARFYTLISKDTNDQEYSLNRQLFLTEQGYRYRILNADEFLSETRYDVLDESETREVTR